MRVRVYFLIRLGALNDPRVGREQTFAASARTGVQVATALPCFEPCPLASEGRRRKWRRGRVLFPPHLHGKIEGGVIHTPRFRRVWDEDDAARPLRSAGRAAQ